MSINVFVLLFVFLVMHKGFFPSLTSKKHTLTLVKSRHSLLCQSPSFIFLCESTFPGDLGFALKSQRMTYINGNHTLCYTVHGETVCFDLIRSVQVFFLTEYQTNCSCLLYNHCKLFNTCSITFSSTNPLAFHLGCCILVHLTSQTSTWTEIYCQWPLTIAPSIDQISMTLERLTLHLFCWDMFYFIMAAEYNTTVSNQ